MPDIRYQVATFTGDPIRPGDEIADVRGDIWIFQRAYVPDGQPARVVVSDGRESQSKDAALFGLRVRPCFADAGGPPAGARS